MYLTKFVFFSVQLNKVNKLKAPRQTNLLEAIKSSFCLLDVGLTNTP